MTETPVTEIEEVLVERGESYGPWKSNSLYASELISAIHDVSERLPPEEEMALVMICMKMARIVTAYGVDRQDSWRDIAGYATLAQKSNRKLIAKLSESRD